MPRLSALVSVAFLLAAASVAGCGEGGVGGGATVSVYVASPLCAEAKRELQEEGGEAGDLEVRAVCLPPTESGGKGDLAAVGAGARRATEDSRSVAYLEAPGSAARFSRSIVEAADIAWVETGAGSAAVRRILKALDERGSSSPRSAVLDQVG